jgi:hypothetical protein
MELHLEDVVQKVMERAKHREQLPAPARYIPTCM